MTPNEFFQRLNKDTMSIVEDFYAPDAVLVDPVGEVHGAKNIRAYYAHQYAALNSIECKMEPEIRDGDQTILQWTMIISHPRIDGGKTISVKGMSKLVLKEGKAVFHQDFFDLGAMVYEHIPVVGSLIGFIKKQMKKGVE